MAWREAITGRVIDAGQRIRVRSALNPALWLSAIVSAPAILGASMRSGETPAWLIVLAYLPVGTGVIGFLFLLCFDRDKLQSEDYQLRKQSLELIQQKGDSFPVSPPSLEAITNPERPLIESASEE
jgi:hypothetical protein